MSAVEKLLKDFPQLAKHESLRQLQTEFERLRLQYEAVKTEYLRVQSEYDVLRQKLGARERRKRSTTRESAAGNGLVVSYDAFTRVERHGVLWLVTRTGQVAPIAHCPLCSAELESFPRVKPALLRCQCGFVARDIMPQDVAKLASDVQQQIAGTTSSAQRPRLDDHGMSQDARDDEHSSSVELPESEYRALLDRSPVMIWRSGLDGAVDYVNEMCVRFTGSPRDRHLGAGWMQNVHPEDRESSVNQYLRSFNRRDSFEIRYRLRRPDGSYSPIISRGTPYYDGHGAFKGFIGGYVDVG